MNDNREVLNAAGQVYYDSFRSFMVFGCTHGSGIKPMSGASPRIKEARLNEGDGEARRKAGLIECSESLLLLLLNGGQGAEQPAGDVGSVEGAAVLEALEASKSRGVVFGAPGGHMP